MQDSKSKSSPVPRGGSNRLLLLASLAGAAFFHLALTIEPLELAVLFPDTSQVIMFQSRRGYTDALQWLESLHSRDELLVLDSILHSPTINSGTPNASNVAGRVARAVASDLPMLVAKVLLQWSLTLYVLRQRALSRPQAVTALVLCAVALVTVKTAHSHVSELLLPGHWRSMTAQQLDSSAQTLSVRFLIRHGASAIVNGMLARAYQLHLSGPLPPIRAQWRKIPRYIGSKNLVISTLFFTAAVAAVMAISAPEFRSLSEASIAIERFALAAALLHLVLIHLSPPGNS